MRYLIFNNTPAHVHLYRHAVVELLNRGHEVLILGRDDACARELLEYYDLPHRIYGRKGPTKGSLAVDLPSQFANIFRHARSYNPDVVFGRGMYAAFGGLVSRTTTVLLFDSIPWRFGYVVPSRVADAVLTTRAFREDLGPHHHRFNGLTEVAYLHPDVFQPDPEVRAELGVETDEPFVIIRFNGFGAFHDVGEGGFTPEEARQLIRRLGERATVFVSDEAGRLNLSELPARPYDLHPARIHDALAEARLFVADAGTMVTEAALLATPTVRATRHGPEDDLGEFRELDDHGLVRNVQPSAAPDVATALLEDEMAPATWLTLRDEFMRDQVDLTSLIVAVAETPERAGELADASFASRRPAREFPAMSNEIPAVDD